MVIIKDNYDNKFELTLINNNFHELFGLVYVHMNKIDPFINFDEIILSFTNDNINYILEHNIESEKKYNSLIKEYNMTIIEKNKFFKYYYNNYPKKILVNEINNINNFIIKLCKKENINDGNFLIMLLDFTTEKIYYKCYVNVVIYEYWDKYENEFVYKKNLEIYKNDNNNYIYDYNNNFNNIIYKLNVISV